MKRILTLITIFTLLFTFTATGSFALDKNKEADKLYKQALKIEKTKPNEAIKLLDKAIAYTPNNPEYYYKRGFLEPNAGKTIFYYERAIVLNPDKYFELCFGGGNADASYYQNNFNGFTISTKIWSLYETDTVGKIKKYLTTYKGDKVKNAGAILDAATDGYYNVVQAFDADNESFVLIYMEPDRKLEITSNESEATLTSKAYKDLTEISNVGEIKSEKIGETYCAYFDFNQMMDGQVMLCRNYSMLYDYHVINIVLYANDQAHFDAALKDFINTYE